MCFQHHCHTAEARALAAPRGRLHELDMRGLIRFVARNSPRDARMAFDRLSAGDPQFRLTPSVHRYLERELPALATAVPWWKGAPPSCT